MIRAIKRKREEISLFETLNLNNVFFQVNGNCIHIVFHSPARGCPAGGKTDLRPTRGPGSCARHPRRSPVLRPPPGSTPGPAALQPGPEQAPKAPQHSCRLRPKLSVPPGNHSHPPSRLYVRVAAPEGAADSQSRSAGDPFPVFAKPRPARPLSATGASRLRQLPGRELPDDRLTPPS